MSPEAVPEGLRSHTLKPGPGKYCLTSNRSMVQKRLGNAVLKDKTQTGKLSMTEVSVKLRLHLRF